MERTYVVALGLLAAYVCQAGAGQGQWRGRRDCLNLANALHAYIEHADRTTSYLNITQEVQWMSSIDLTNLSQLRRLACRIEGKSAAEVAEYAAASGIARRLVRRTYGHAIVYYRMYRSELERIVDAGGPSLTTALTDLLLRTVTALDKKGFMCIEGQAAKEVIAWSGLELDADVGCEDFSDLARDLASLVDANTRITVTAITGLHLSDTANIAQLVCDIAESDNFDDLVDVLDRNFILEHAIAYAFHRLPAIIGPISQFELTLQLTNDEDLVERFNFLQGAPPAEIAEFRKNARLAVNLYRELKKLSDGIRLSLTEAEIGQH